jgi:hypothetical protein
MLGWVWFIIYVVGGGGGAMAILRGDMIFFGSSILGVLSKKLWDIEKKTVWWDNCNR